MKHTSLAHTVVRASRLVNHVSYHAAILLTAAMVVLVAIQVVARYGFHAPPQWTEEAARYCMVWAALLGSTVSFFEHADPTISTPPKILLRLSARLVVLVRTLSVYIFVLPILWYVPGFISRQSLRTTDALEWNSAIIVSIIPIWGVILLLHAGAEVAAAWKGYDRSLTERQS